DADRFILVMGSRRRSAVERVLHGFRRGEGQLLRGRDLDRRTGRRVATLARRRVLHLELSEPRNAGLAAGTGGLRNLTENTFDDRLGLRLGEALLGSNLVGNLSCCRHSANPSM